MCKAFKIIRRILLIAVGAYAALFAVFFFDLDGKALYHFVEPFLVKHYDKMPRKDTTKQVYDITGKDF